MRINIFTVGGTIDKVYFDQKSEYEIGDSQAANVFEEALVSFNYTIVPLMRKDSLEMSAADRALIRARIEAGDCRLCLVTHGTDTMVETAKTLRGIPGKVIVLTGALSPARFRYTDAIFNLGLAVGALQALPEGVYIAMNGCIFEPEKVRKNRAQNRFEGVAS